MLAIPLTSSLVTGEKKKSTAGLIAIVNVNFAVGFIFSFNDLLIFILLFLAGRLICVVGQDGFKTSDYFYSHVSLRSYSMGKR